MMGARVGLCCLVQERVGSTPDALDAIREIQRSSHPTDKVVAVLKAVLLLTGVPERELADWPAMRRHLHDVPKFVETLRKLDASKRRKRKATRASREQLHALSRESEVLPCCRVVPAASFAQATLAR